MDKWFEPNNKDEIRQCIENLYAQGISRGKGKIRHELYEHSWRGIFTAPIL